MNNASNIRNIGPRSLPWLHAVGVESVEDLRQRGVANTYFQIRRAGYPASLNLLWALAGAARDCHWNQIPTQVKKDLLLEIDAIEDYYKHFALAE